MVGRTNVKNVRNRRMRRNWWRGKERKKEARGSRHRTQFEREGSTFWRVIIAGVGLIGSFR